MAGKARVHELAKELGVPSKTVLAKLKEMGEFVKSASSTVEAPVARRLKEEMAAVLAAQAQAAASDAQAPAGEAGTATPTKAAKAARKGPVPTPPSGGLRPASAHDIEVAAAEARAAALKAEQEAAVRAAREAQQRREQPTESDGGAPRPPARSGGNNPFGITPATIRPTPASMPPRPSPASMPPRPSPASMPAQRPTRPGPVPGGRGSGRPTRGGIGGGRGAAVPRGGTAAPPYRGAPPGLGRPGGRGRGGGAAGAFGRPGGKPTRGRKSRKQRRQEFDNLAAPTTMGSGAPRGHGQTVRLPRGASLADFAEKIDANPASLVQELFTLGEMVTATQSCSDETLQLLGEHLGYDVQIVSPEDEDRELLAQFNIDLDAEVPEDKLVTRPPVVTVMGHVDHGKTKLLDTIRRTNVVEGEAGGITQHIGAYQVHVEHEGEQRAITFIDTPGHEAFTAMRARGAQVTDIVILVVAADDGVMPQTVEALNHAKAANVPIVVAVNKIDKPEANPARVRQQLTEYGLVAEEYGGDTMFVDVAAKPGIGIDKLLEAVLLTADAALELKAPVEGPAQGVAIEAHLDRGRGAVATVLVQKGTLRTGDSIVVGSAHGRVRAMLDENGQPVQEAGPSRPVQVLGLTSVPSAGDMVLAAGDDRTVRQIAEQRQARRRAAQMASTRSRATLESVLEQIKEGEKTSLNLILKGDVSGSVEALEDALFKLDIPDEVQLKVIDRGVGAITESNVMLASASDAIIIGFNVRAASASVRQLAEREGVDIRYYTVIYQALEEVQAALKGLLKPVYEEVELGTAEVRAIFRSSRYGTIAGCVVRSGTIRRNARARLVRDGAVVADNLSIVSLRREKDDVSEVREGFECGLTLGYNDIREGDVVETFELREKARE
ncbi:MAG: translation initiation factor IF-2 [Micromonosporaceae bacterium]